MLRKWIYTVASLLVGMAAAQAQIKWRVTVNTNQMNTTQVTEKAIFNSLKADINTFLNGQRWSEDEYEEAEKIECDVRINITNMLSQNNFQATAQLRAVRPVFKTDYESVLINYVDRNFQFTYTQSQPLLYNDNAYNNNLTSMLAFYAYTVLAMDYFSFKKNGGKLYAERALQVVNNAQAASEPGWRPNQVRRNRYWLSEILMSQQMLGFLEGIYVYHRQGLDRFLFTPDKSRKKILEVLKTMEQINTLKPSAILIRSFMDAKSDELINIFIRSPKEERQAVYRILVKVDPSKTQKYSKLIE
jgi:hypothetical protein